MYRRLLGKLGFGRKEVGLDGKATDAVLLLGYRFTGVSRNPLTVKAGRDQLVKELSHTFRKLQMIQENQENIVVGEPALPFSSCNGFVGGNVLPLKVLPGQTDVIHKLNSYLPPTIKAFDLVEVSPKFNIADWDRATCSCYVPTYALEPSVQGYEGYRLPGKILSKLENTAKHVTSIKDLQMFGQNEGSNSNVATVNNISIPALFEKEGCEYLQLVIDFSGLGTQSVEQIVGTALTVTRSDFDMEEFLNIISTSQTKLPHFPRLILDKVDYDKYNSTVIQNVEYRQIGWLSSKADREMFKQEMFLPGMVADDMNSKMWWNEYLIVPSEVKKKEAVSVTKTGEIMETNKHVTGQTFDADIMLKTEEITRSGNAEVIKTDEIREQGSASFTEKDVTMIKGLDDTRANLDGEIRHETDRNHISKTLKAKKVELDHTSKIVKARKDDSIKLPVSRTSEAPQDDQDQTSKTVRAKKDNLAHTSKTEKAKEIDLDHRSKIVKAKDNHPKETSETKAKKDNLVHTSKPEKAKKVEIDHTSETVKATEGHPSQASETMKAKKDNLVHISKTEKAKGVDLDHTSKPVKAKEDHPNQTNETLISRKDNLVHTSKTEKTKEIDLDHSSKTVKSKVDHPNQTSETVKSKRDNLVHTSKTEKAKKVDLDYTSKRVKAKIDHLDQTNETVRAKMVDTDHTSKTVRAKMVDSSKLNKSPEAMVDYPEHTRKTLVARKDQDNISKSAKERNEDINLTRETMKVENNKMDLNSDTMTAKKNDTDHISKSVNVKMIDTDQSGKTVSLSDRMFLSNLDNHCLIDQITVNKTDLLTNTDENSFSQLSETNQRKAPNRSEKDINNQRNDVFETKSDIRSEKFMVGMTEMENVGQNDENAEIKLPDVHVGSKPSNKPKDVTLVAIEELFYLLSSTLDDMHVYLSSTQTAFRFGEKQHRKLIKVEKNNITYSFPYDMETFWELDKTLSQIELVNGELQVICEEMEKVCSRKVFDAVVAVQEKKLQDRWTLLSQKLYRTQRRLKRSVEVTKELQSVQNKILDSIISQADTFRKVESTSNINEASESEDSGVIFYQPMDSKQLPDKVILNKTKATGANYGRNKVAQSSTHRTLADKTSMKKKLSDLPEEKRVKDDDSVNSGTEKKDEGKKMPKLEDLW